MAIEQKLNEFSHLNEDGDARMVDVGNKAATHRIAKASAQVHVQQETIAAIKENGVKKGDVLQVARLAGIMAAKQTPNLIPLCHPIGLDSVEVDFAIEGNVISVSGTASVHGKTGVEMEAMTAVSVAALTIYDMCKSMDRQIRISDVQLEEKSGGKSGDFIRKDAK